MFDQTFVDGTGKTHKSWTVVIDTAQPELDSGEQTTNPDSLS